jgi:hypothetical protein
LITLIGMAACVDVVASDMAALLRAIIEAGIDWRAIPYSNHRDRHRPAGGIPYNNRRTPLSRYQLPFDDWSSLWRYEITHGRLASVWGDREMICHIALSVVASLTVTAKPATKISTTSRDVALARADIPGVHWVLHPAGNRGAKTCVRLSWEG